MKKVKNRFFLLWQKIITLSATTFDLPNVGQANCILKHFENMMIDHLDSTIF